METRNVVLVTGGAGYIGSHVCKALKMEGFDPVVFDDLSQGHPWAVKWGDFEQGSVLDRESLFSVVEKHNPIGIIHLAGKIVVSESWKKPEYYYENNVEGMRNVIDVAQQLKIKHFLFSSTAAVYGTVKEFLIKEDACLDPGSPYGSTKLEAEKILMEKFKNYEGNFIIFRFFNASGADLDGDTGEAHYPETHLIPRVLDAAKGEGEFVVYGNDYPTKDGTCIRDYIHVSDLAQANILGLNYLMNGGKSEIFNLGTEEPYSVLDVLKTAQNITKKEIKYRVEARREGDMPLLVASNGKAKKILGWEPKYSQLETIVESAWKWHNYNQPKI
ncbi:MAG: UDP-glucose 4-epimerase GalE [Verrucomicrobia bacterium GWC2_42_7]|nr:MAG: UDP-glucose 4-epimerase GalE [Verrucomicrobia bacterium GWC2_42_7]